MTAQAAAPRHGTGLAASLPDVGDFRLVLELFRAGAKILGLVVALGEEQPVGRGALPTPVPGLVTGLPIRRNPGTTTGLRNLCGIAAN
jgi:hypothetical protein